MKISNIKVIKHVISDKLTTAAVRQGEPKPRAHSLRIGQDYEVIFTDRVTKLPWRTH